MSFCQFTMFSPFLENGEKNCRFSSVRSYENFVGSVGLGSIFIVFYESVFHIPLKLSQIFLVPNFRTEKYIAPLFYPIAFLLNIERVEVQRFSELIQRKYIFGEYSFAWRIVLYCKNYYYNL